MIFGLPGAFKWGAIAASVLAVVALIGRTFFAVKKAGRNEQIIKGYRETHEQIEEGRRNAERIRVDVINASDDDLDQRLRERGL